MQWASIYLADAQKRLAPYLKGLTLSASLLSAMQQTCAYEVCTSCFALHPASFGQVQAETFQTVALGYSAFCDLFTEEEWKGYEYATGKCSCET